MNNKLVTFYLNHVDKVHQFTEEELENRHDYIQWLFPLTEISQFNKNAPILDEETINQFKDNFFLRQNLKKSFNVMMHFYGFEYKPHLTWNEINNHWITEKNHNFLRITRIMKSMCILGCEDLALELKEALDEMKPKIIRGESFEDIAGNAFDFWDNIISVAHQGIKMK